MKVGADAILLISCKDIDTTAITSVIWTLSSSKSTLTKTYPSVVSYSNGFFSIPLTQENTVALGNGLVRVEGQINYTNKAVTKTVIEHFTLNGTLATEVVTGNAPSGNVDLSDITFSIVDNVVIAKVEGDVSPEDIASAVEDYMEEHPVDAVTESQMQTYVTTAISGKADKTEIPSLNGYATETWVTNKGYLTEHQPIKTVNNQSLIGSGNIVIESGSGVTIDDTTTSTTKTWSSNKISSELSLKANSSDIPSLSGYATQSWVESKNYLTTANYSDIADIVYNMLDNAEGGSY